MNNTVNAIQAIREKHGLTGRQKPKHEINDSIKCPVCNGVLRYTISSYNGHIWGMCKTKNCLRWME